MVAIVQGLISMSSVFFLDDTCQIIWYVFFCIWIMLFSIKNLVSIHVAINGKKFQN